VTVKRSVFKKPGEKKRRCSIKKQAGRVFMSDMILILLVVGLACFFIHHYVTKRKRAVAGCEMQLVESAAKHSLSASNTTCPLLALHEITQATAILDVLRTMVGTEKLYDLAGPEFVTTIEQQRDRILSDVVSRRPDLAPMEHPMSEAAGYGR
jgi:hypothetical protein